MSSYNAYHNALFLHHNEHERWNALAEVQTELETAELWMLIWELIEASLILFPNQEIMRRLFTAERINHPGRLAAFIPDDKEWMKRALRRGGPMKLYRGGAQANMTGLAWTTSKAEAYRHAMASGARKATITVGYMRPSDMILAFYDSRTIITLPEKVNIKHVEEITTHISQEEQAARTLKVAVAWKGANAPMECTPLEYFQHAIGQGSADRDDVVRQLTASRKYLEAFGFKARIERIDEVLAGL